MDREMDCKMIFEGVLRTNAEQDKLYLVGDGLYKYVTDIDGAIVRLCNSKRVRITVEYNEE